ncbi:hypothetical protein DL96DRAFT_1641938 [Flagelloscypha sp. PMI_526]|nr:hypothetical protein DL96DRAFT_1641938 [Flagelloscypha sp. PMI_526]
MNHQELKSFVSLSAAPIDLRGSPVPKTCCTPSAHLFDEHLADNLLLKRVVIMDGLAEKLCSLGDNVLKELDTYNHLDRVGLSDAIGTSDTNAEGIHRVTELYRPVADMSRHLAHAFVFSHGEGGGWASEWASLDDEECRRISPAVLTHSNFALRTLLPDSSNTDTTLNQMNSTKRPVLHQNDLKREKSLQRSSIVLAVWMMMEPRPRVNRALTNMCNQPAFPWRYSSMKWPRNLAKIVDRGRYQKDANAGPCVEWIRPTRPLPRPRSLRSSSGSNSLSPSSPSSIPQTLSFTPFEYKELIHDNNHFIQRLWTESVRSDTTFMIFHSGNSQRIAIRQRATQTLILSSLIPITRNLDYTRIQLGLHVAIIQDALARNDELDLDIAEVKHPDGAPPVPRHKKRKGKHGGVTKRLKLDPAVFGDAEGLLLNIQSQVYDSPAPCLLFPAAPVALSKLSRPRSPVKLSHRNPSLQRRPVKYSRCIELTAGEVLGSGSTGLAQLANFSSSVSGKSSQYPPFVVKLAFGLEARRRLSHEAAVYHRLRQKKVKEVPQYFGLFEDGNQSVTVLVTEFTGRDMSDETVTGKMWPEPGTDKEYHLHKLDRKLRPALKQAVTEIHRAGVVHDDFKFDNVTKIPGQGQDPALLCLIDFDRAILNPTKQDKERELRRMHDISEGRKGYIGFGTTPVHSLGNTNSC